MHDTQETTIDQSLVNNVNGWHEIASEKKAFLDLINFEGFLLEEAVNKILSRCRHPTELHPGEVFEGAPHRGGGRVEIDMWVKIIRRIFLIESKRSDYDWVFLQNKESDKDVHLIFGKHDQISVLNRTFDHINCVSKEVVEVQEADSDPTLLREKGKRANLPMRTTRDEYVRNYLRQALFNMEVLIHNQMSTTSSEEQRNFRFVPIIVTNAKLLLGTYSSSDIDRNARLTKIDFQPIKVAAFNHSEIMKWGPEYEKILSHIGQPAYGRPLFDDERFIGHHNKTVFIVSKDHLFDFIDHSMNWG